MLILLTGALGASLGGAIVLMAMEHKYEAKVHELRMALSAARRRK